MRLLKVALTLSGVSAGVFFPSEAQAFGRRGAVCVPARQACYTSQPANGQPCMPNYCSPAGSVMRSFGAGVPGMSGCGVSETVVVSDPIVGVPIDPSIKVELEKILKQLQKMDKAIGEPKDKEEILLELLKQIRDKIK